MDDAPEFIVLGNLAECAAVAEYDNRDKVRLLAADFQETLQRKNVPDVLPYRVVERVLGMLVQVLRPAFAFEVPGNFAGEVLAFKNVNSRLV